jgi:hypothetical protein
MTTIDKLNSLIADHAWEHAVRRRVGTFAGLTMITAVGMSSLFLEYVKWIAVVIVLLGVTSLFVMRWLNRWTRDLKCPNCMKSLRSSIKTYHPILSVSECPYCHAGFYKDDTKQEPEPAG